MASISLRAYNKEIEALIENDQVKDAIAHSRHILRQFPKHLETYRLLGKAYLESQRYTEAADVLQRVLSSLPDDFVSQIGMSMIREDEGNLDAAIFHMERAFEAQPSNSAVQEELKRLYGRRDGVVPAKIRLTRGALVRMYARGDLFQQAIAEARVALAENPDRVELEVILARMFFLSGQKVSATEVASRLIEKLPYCYEANRILADVLPGTARADDARVYNQRLVALDPYLAHVAAGSSSGADAPDDAIKLEIYDGEIEEEPSAQLDWAQAAGVKMEETDAEALPDWLMTPEAGKTEPEIEPIEEPIEEVLPATEEATPGDEAVAEVSAPAEGTPEIEEELPDWMQSAGWQPSSGDTPEVPASEDIADIYEGATSEMAASEAEIPDWLQAIAPTDEPNEPAEEIEGAPSDEDNSWLESILSETDQKTGSLSDLELTPEGESGLIEAVGQEAELPSSMNEDFLAEIEPLPDALAADNEIPDWLTGLAEIEAVPEASVESTSDDDWLEILASKEPELPEAELAAIDEGSEKFEAVDDFWTEPELETQAAAALETPAEPFASSWDEESTAEEVAPFAVEFMVTPEKSTDDFLTELEAASPVDADATQPTRVRKPEEVPSTEIPVVEEMPFEETVPEELTAEETPPEEVEAFAEDEEEKGVFAEDLENIEEVEPVVDEPVSTEAVTEQPSEARPMLMDEEDLSIFDLVEPGEEQSVHAGLQESTSVEAEAESEDIYVPDWLKESLENETDEVEPEAVAEDLQAADLVEPAVSDEMAAETIVEEPSELEDDAAFAWLEALAARQGADEEALQVAPEERSEETPEWIKSEIEQVEVEADEPPAPPEMAPEFDLEEEAVQESESEITGEEERVVNASFETPAIEIEQPTWSEQEAPVATGETEAEIDKVDVPAVDEELPAWFKETLAADEATELEAVETEETPIITRGAGEWQPEEDLQPEFTAQSPAEPAALDEPSAETSTEITSEAAEELEPVVAETTEPVAPAVTPEDTEPEEVPDWLQGLAEEQAEVAPIAKVDAEAPPEWLKELEDEEFGILPAVPYSASTGQTGWLKKAEEAAPVDKVEDTSPIRVTPTPSIAQPVPVSSDDLYNAQAALNAQDIDSALEHYNRLINRGEALEDTIHDLRDAIYRYPVDVNIWQSLGDAYMRSNQLQEALDAYTKAEELLR